MDVEELKRKVAISCRILGYAGMADHLGHSSARIPGTDLVLIKARSSRKVSSLKRTKVSDIITVDLKGRKVEGPEELIPPTETKLHTCIYERRSDVLGVVHAHPHISTAFAIAQRNIEPVFHWRKAYVVAKPPPVFNSSVLISTDELGYAVADLLGDGKACLLRWHGIVTVGRSIEEATINAVNLEEQAKMNLLALQLGKVERMPANEMSESPEERIGADWAYLEGLVLEEPL